MKTKHYLRNQKPNAIMKKKREPIKEARRYVDNAREILLERGKCCLLPPNPFCHHRHADASGYHEE